MKRTSQCNIYKNTITAQGASDVGIFNLNNLVIDCSNGKCSLKTTKTEDGGSTNQSIISNNKITACNGSSNVGMFNCHNIYINTLYINVGQALGGCEGNEGFLKHKAETEAWGAAPQLPPLVVGLDFPLRELKRKLLKDEVSMLVLTSLGGGGKTTLATTFCQDQEVKDIFRDNIFFVTVSRNSKLEHIVQQLYKHRFSKPPTFQNEVVTVRWLHYFLTKEAKNPLLLVLDDVWSGSESLLEVFHQFSMPNCKLLVTSRFEFRRFGSSYHLPSLKYDNAMKLFDHSASLGHKSSHIPQDLLRQIVNHCKGFPLAIKVLGRSLCGQPIEIWKHRLIELSFHIQEPHRIEESAEDILVHV